MEIHRSILIVVLGLLGVWTLIGLALNATTIFATQESFFEGWSLVSYGALALIFATPLVCFLLAFAVYRRWQTWALVILLVDLSLALFPLGLAVSVYFLWWWYPRRVVSAS